MFIAESQNSETLTELIQSESNKLLAVAFIGSGFSNSVNGNVRIVCNLTSGATNPYEIKALLNKQNIEIKNNSKLHAKVYIETDRLIVSSANLSTNGIALEEESAYWIEASIQTKVTEDIMQATTWFNKLWAESESITQQMINDSIASFKGLRNARPTHGKSIKSLMDRNIYCVFYKDDISDKAEEVADGVLGENWYDNGYGIYEDFDDLPNGTLIDFHLEKDKLKYEGVWIYDGYEVKSNNLSIQIVKKYSPKKDQLFINQVKTIVDKELKRLWPGHKTEECIIIHINDVIRYSS
jgi:hypothetical protein